MADLTIVRVAKDPRPVVATTPPHHYSSSGFLASFYATWPESEVFDDSSRRIWDTRHLGFAQADSVYEALDDRQSSMQKTFDARHASLQHSTKTDFCHLESYVYPSTSKAEDAVAAALQCLDRADATLVTLLESLTNMKHHLATTTKTVVDGFSEHAKTLAAIKNGLSSQTTALAALEAWLRTHGGLLDQLSRTSEAQSTCLDDVMACVGSTADTLRDDVAEVRARLIPDLRSEVKALDATLPAALARLPPTDNPIHMPASNSPTDQDALHSAPTADMTAATNGTSSTSDDKQTATAGTWYQDVSHGAPADGNTTTNSMSCGTPTTSAAPHNVRFGITRDLRDGQAPQSSFGDSRFGPTRLFMSPSHSDDSWYLPETVCHTLPPAQTGAPSTMALTMSIPRINALPASPRQTRQMVIQRWGGRFGTPTLIQRWGGRSEKSSRLGSMTEKIARDRQLSIFDIPGLANDLYHGGSDGVEELTITFLHECGYNSFAPEAPEDVLLCYRDIQLVHRKVMSGWFNSRSSRSGPPLEYIIEKALPNFPKLKSLDAWVAVDFYDRLQKISAGYLYPLMPFDAIKLSFKFEGLCPPGLGTSRYGEIGSALMDILPASFRPLFQRLHRLLLLWDSSPTMATIFSGGCWSSPSLVLIPRFPSCLLFGVEIPTSSNSARPTSSTSIYSPRSTTTLMHARDHASSSGPSCRRITPTS